jgi:hypothetical protein
MMKETFYINRINTFFLALILILFCSHCSSVSSKRTNTPISGIGVLNDTRFTDFLQIKLPSLQENDTLIQVELFYDLNPKELFFLHKKKNNVHLSYRLFDIEPTPQSLDTIHQTNNLTGETITWELLKKRDKEYNLNTWFKLQKSINNIGVNQMPPFTNDFVLGGTRTLLSFYTSKSMNSIIRHSQNDTINKVITFLREL